MIDADRIAAGLRSLLETNMGLAAGERVLIVSDAATPAQWETMDRERLANMARRTYLGRLVRDVAAAEYRACRFDLHVYPATGRHGMEPPPETAARLKEADVLVLLTTYSLSHTVAREEACRAGARAASMPSFLPEMLYPDGPMAVDYQVVAAETARWARLLDRAASATVRCPAGTDLTFSLEGRAAREDAGLYRTPGSWGNLPAGEAYIAPLEGTAAGRLVVRAGWYPGLDANLILVFERGSVVRVEGGGKVGREIAGLLGLAGESGRETGAEVAVQRARRVLAELGIGTNPNARRPDNILEAEKIRGTVHLAIGDNSHMGGTNAADYHQDFIIPEADLILDGAAAMAGGRGT